ncbi:MAG TPA: CoA transferase [Acidimicrobiales bacterium]|jgi:formyl-CoA transferase/succinyl-CoA--D-citramalate CoA-transferase|nr:CoA transferase [Acidimicrobiales bacterium]
MAEDTPDDTDADLASSPDPLVDGPLTGVRVLELGSFIAGPFAGQLLGDYGAEVIKIEPPGVGDPMRAWGQTRDGDSLWWPAIARNKRSVTVDLRREEGRALVREIAASCDLVIENFRPGRLDEWGLGHADLAARNPRLVTVHISGFGQDGPRATAAGFGSIGEAVGGIRHTTGSPDRAPARAGVSLGDALAAVFGVIGGLAAYTAAQRTGRGQEVDVAIYEAVFALMESTLADYELAGVIRGRSGSVLPGVAPSNVYPTADGSEILIAANADTVYGRLCTAMDQPELATDERYATHSARGEHMEELDERISEWTRSLTADKALDILDEHGVPAGRIFTAPDMLADPHFEARKMVLRRRSHQGWDVPMNGIVPKFTATPGSVRATGPALGQDTRDILTNLAGVSEAELDRLHDAGLI